MRRKYNVLTLAGLALLAGCTEPGGAPTPDRAGVEPSAKGLAELFQRDCIDQKNLDWVRDEVERRRWWRCHGADNSDDCMLDAALAIEWQVKASSNDTIAVTLVLPSAGDVPRPGLAQCEIAVPEHLGGVLKSAVGLLRVDGRKLSSSRAEKITGTTGSDFDLIWPAGRISDRERLIPHPALHAHRQIRSSAEAPTGRRPA